MGLTIHFSGQLRDAHAYGRLMDIAKEFAEKQNYATTEIAEEAKLLLRVTDDEQEWNYEGPVTGLRLDLHPDAEPFYLEFDRDLYVQEHIKTQFAGAELHATVIGFLRRIHPLFLNLKVLDEAEYWETNDFPLLQRNLARCSEVIEEHAAKNPGSQVKVHTPDGRIIDLLE